MSIDYAKHFKGKRLAILNLLSDLAWHSGPALQHVGGARFGARVLELRRLGMQIETRAEVDNDGVTIGAFYRLKSLHPALPQPKRVRIMLNQVDAERLIAGVVTFSAMQVVAQALSKFTRRKECL